MAEQKNNLPPKILIVDDDPSIAQALEGPLGRYNIRVEKATNLDTALYLFNQQRFEVVFVEIEFDPLPGLGLVQRWREHEIEERRCCGFVLTSGNKQLGKNEGLIRELGDLEVIKKPFGVAQILPYLSRAQATHRRLLAYREMQGKLEAFVRTGNIDKAAEQVKSKLQDLGPKGFTMLYDLYEKGERFDDALAIIDPLLAKDPQNISLLNAKGRMLMRLGRFEEAKVCMEQADKLAPQNIGRLQEMAEMYIELGQPKETVAKYKEILSMHPDQPDQKFEMFGRLFDAGFNEDAVAFGQDSAKPMEIVRHYNNKGVLLSRDQKQDDAIQEYHRAIQFYPSFKENYRIYFNIALACMKDKTLASYEEAEKHLRKCLELAPKFEKAQKALETVERLLEKAKAG